MTTMSTSVIINLVDTDDEEFYHNLETQRAILNSDDSSTTPVIIDLVDTDDDEFHLDIKAQRADIKPKVENMDHEYNTPSS
ncbi:hypothetical protein BGX27_006139, partial [Mortierella sp. AM989]